MWTVLVSCWVNNDMELLMETCPGPGARCIWSEQKYSKGLLLQAKQKILKMKAYEAAAFVLFLGEDELQGMSQQGNGWNSSSLFDEMLV